MCLLLTDVTDSVIDSTVAEVSLVTFVWTIAVRAETNGVSVNCIGTEENAPCVFEKISCMNGHKKNANQRRSETKNQIMAASEYTKNKSRANNKAGVERLIALCLLKNACIVCCCIGG